MKNLGVALAALGIQEGGQKGLRYLEESIRAFDNALSVFDERNFPRKHVFAAKTRSQAIAEKEALAKSLKQTARWSSAHCIRAA